MHGSTGSCYDKALQLLAQRPHFKSELVRKLSSRGFDSELIATSLDRLEKEKYLDDLAFATEWAAGSLRRRGFGVNGLRRELQKRGLEEEVTSAVIDQAFPDGDTALAKKVGHEWMGRGGRSREALARHLERKGFSRASIWKVVENFEPNDPDDSN